MCVCVCVCERERERDSVYECVYMHILKTTFASLGIQYLTIQSIFPFALDTTEEIWLSALNVSSKSNPSITFLIYFFHLPVA